MTRWSTRLRADAEQRLWPTAALLTAVAGLATFANAGGEYIGDNRYDQFASPGTRLSRSLSLWDGTRGLGRVREDLWPGLTTPLAIIRGLGVPVWASERIFHTGLIVLGGLGMVAVIRVFRPRIGLGHLLGALLYAFGPYSAAFLQPSNLYAAYTAAPWLAVIALRGPPSTRPWRWAALFALVIFLLGNVDPPGVLFVCLVVVPALTYLVAVERQVTLRRAVGWLVRAGVLTLGVSLAVLYKTWVAAATFGNRLDTTESPTIVNVASSWTESLRGLGFWVSYFRGSSLARPQTEILFSNPVIVFATLVVPILALLSIAFVGGRPRVFMASSALLAAAVMVGTFPIGGSSPFGGTISWLYRVVPPLAAFRSSYKIGALLVIGIAGLIALGFGEMQRRLAGNSQARSVASAAVFLVVAATAVPFWSGSLYDTTKGFDAVPAYWTQAVDYVDHLPGAGRILVLPGSTRTQYRWGWVGDDIVDALMHRDHAIDTAIPLSEPLAADLLHTISVSVGDGTYQAGTIAPILRRLGIDRILIRNDTDWDAGQTYRPAALDPLRKDKDLRLLRTFGRRGQNTTVDGDHTAAGNRERRLPPIEIYQLVEPGPAGPRLAATDARPLLVSGDGSAWPGLSSTGYLADSGPVRYTATLAAPDLAAEVAGSRGVVVTDTNRRRVATVTGFQLDEGPTLAAGQDQDRKAADLFDEAGSQTVAWFTDATRIGANGASRGLQGAQPASRPAAAFDGNPTTAWTTFESANQVGIRLRIDLRRATTLSHADLTAVNAADGVNHVTAARLRFSDGSSVDVPLTGRSGAVTFKRRTVSWVEVEIAQVSGGDPHPVGFSEITFDGLDLNEWISLPDDLARRAKADPAVARAMASVPLTYQVQRAAPVAGLAVEPVIRRRFYVPSTRTFTVRGAVTPTATNTVTIARALATGCRNPATLTVGDQPVPLRLVGSPADVQPGESLPVVGCTPVTLSSGWQRLSVSGAPVSSLSLRAPGRTPTGATAIPPPSSNDTTTISADSRVRILSQSPGRYSLMVDAADGGRLISGQSFEQRWTATVDGRSLGAAVPLDTLSGWQLPKGRALHVTLVYRPQARYPAVTMLSVLFVVLCLALVFRRSRQAPSTSSS